MPGIVKDILLIAVVSVVAVTVVNQTPLQPIVTGQKRLIGSV